MHRDAGEWKHGGGIVPSALSKGEQRGRRCLSHNGIMGNVMVYQDRLESNFIAAIRETRKFRIMFYNFCYYFWDQHCWWTETNIICNDFFVSFRCAQLFYCSPCPTAAPACLNMHVASTNFTKTLVCKREFDVILWRHKQFISSTNDHHTPLLNTRIWKGGIQWSSRPGITRPLNATVWVGQ